METKAKSKKPKRESPERIVLEAMLGKRVSIMSNAGLEFPGRLVWVDMFSFGLLTDDKPGALPEVFFKGNVVRARVID